MNKPGLFVVCFLLVSNLSGAAEPELILQRFNDFPHVSLVDRSEQEVVDHEVGLGALQKVLGVWQFKDSQRMSGHLQRYTWQIVDGYSAADLLAALEAEIASKPLFSCDGRACGHGAQWANRVFQQRVLYGRAENQRYRVYRLSSDGEYLLSVYAAARTADRQYLHADLLRSSQAEVAVGD